MSRYYNSPLLEAIIPLQNLPIPPVLPWDHIRCYFSCCSILYIEYPQDGRTRLEKTPHNQTVCLKSDPRFPTAPHFLALLQEINPHWPNGEKLNPPWVGFSSWKGVEGLEMLKPSLRVQNVWASVRWTSVKCLWCWGHPETAGIVQTLELLFLSKLPWPSGLDQALVLRTSLWPWEAIILEQRIILSRIHLNCILKRREREAQEFTDSVPTNPTWSSSSSYQDTQPDLWLVNPSLFPMFSLWKLRGR